MAVAEPGIEEVEQDIAELLRAEEIGSLAVVGPTGAPAVSMMHFASDGLVVYLHTFTYSRKHEAIARDPRVSYTIAAIPPDGFYGRAQLRAIQVDGLATFVTEPEEIQRAVEVSRDQFDWLKDSSMLDTFAKGTAHHQAFIRIDPVEALWNDNRVRQLWRKIVTFTGDGRHVAALSPFTPPANGAQPAVQRLASRKLSATPSTDHRLRRDRWRSVEDRLRLMQSGWDSRH